MSTHQFHLCPKCSKKFTPRYKVAQYKGDKEFCPCCKKNLQPPKQARSVENLIRWSHDAGITLHFAKDLGSELLYVCDGKWKHFDARVNKQGRIFATAKWRIAPPMTKGNSWNWCSVTGNPYLGKASTEHSVSRNTSKIVYIKQEENVMIEANEKQG